MASDRHRITGQHTDLPLVVAGPKGELVTLDELTFDEARTWHYKLSEQHEPHFWQAYAGPRTGWNSVAGLWESADRPQDLAAARGAALS